MAKIGLVIKQESERILKDKLRDADSFLLVKYSGLSASDLNVLRSSLSDIDSCLMVTKNCIGKRVFKDTKGLSSFIDGPCGVIFVNKDLIATSRAVYNFAKDKPNLEVKAGVLKDRILTQQEIETLSKILSLSALHSQVIGALKSPIFGIVFGLKQILNKLACVLGQIKDKKNK